MSKSGSRTRWVRTSRPCRSCCLRRWYFGIVLHLSRGNPRRPASANHIVGVLALLGPSLEHGSLRVGLFDEPSHRLVIPFSLVIGLPDGLHLAHMASSPRAFTDDDVSNAADPFFNYGHLSEPPYHLSASPLLEHFLMITGASLASFYRIPNRHRLSGDMFFRSMCQEQNDGVVQILHGLLHDFRIIEHRTSHVRDAPKLTVLTHTTSATTRMSRNLYGYESHCRITCLLISSKCPHPDCSAGGDDPVDG